MPTGLHFRLEDYIELVDCSGRRLRNNKREAIGKHYPPTPHGLENDPQHWIHLNKKFESRFTSLVGNSNTVRTACERLANRWVHGLRKCERLFSPPSLIC